MSNTNPEIKISSTADLKSKLDLNPALAWITEITETLTFTQSELDDLKGSISTPNPNANNIEEINKKIAEKVDVLSQTQSQTSSLKLEIGDTFNEQDIEAIKKVVKEMENSHEVAKQVFSEIITHIDLLNNKPEQKKLVLWSLFSVLNRYWVSLYEVKWNKIQLKAWVETKWVVVLKHEDVLHFQELINWRILSWKLTPEEVQTALLYRTSSLDDFIKEKNDSQLSTTDYAVRLLNKYKITISSDKPVTSENLASELKGFPQEKYNDFKTKILWAITDSQADREFIIGYLDNLKYDGGKAIQEDNITEYKKTRTENAAIVQWLHELNKLDSATKYALWVRMTDTLEWKKQEWTNDPMGAFLKNLSGDAWILGVFMWIIWAIFWGKKWFLGGLLWGFWLWALGTDWIKWSVNWTAEIWNEGIDAISKWVTEKLPWLTQEAKEKASFWYNFREISMSKNGTQVDLTSAKFLTLLHAKEANNLWWLLKKNWENISQSELKAIEEKIVEYRMAWTDANDGNREKFLEDIKNMSVWEVIAYIYTNKEQRTTSPGAIASNSNATLTWDNPDLII